MDYESVCSEHSHWYILVPKQQNFIAPQFHFGQKVYWTDHPTERAERRKSGQIVGMQFISPQMEWQYHIAQNKDIAQSTCLEVLWIREKDLVAQQDSVASPSSGFNSPWLATASAATQLGVSARQLRKLRSQGLFKVGYHYRDMSVPGSGLPRWQWHVERCERALAIPPAKRSSK